MRALTPFLEPRTVPTVPVQLTKEVIVFVEVAQSGRFDVGFDVKQFEPVAEAIKG